MANHHRHIYTFSWKLLTLYSYSYANFVVFLFSVFKIVIQYDKIQVIKYFGECAWKILIKYLANAPTTHQEFV